MADPYDRTTQDTLEEGARGVVVKPTFTAPVKLLLNIPPSPIDDIPTATVYGGFVSWLPFPTGWSSSPQLSNSGHSVGRPASLRSAEAPHRAGNPEASWMTVSSQIFAYLECPTKCWLRSPAEPPAGNVYAEWVRGQCESYRQDGLKVLLASIPESACVIDPPISKNSKTQLGA